MGVTGTGASAGAAHGRAVAAKSAELGMSGEEHASPGYNLLWSVTLLTTMKETTMPNHQTVTPGAFPAVERQKADVIETYKAPRGIGIGLESVTDEVLIRVTWIFRTNDDNKDSSTRVATRARCYPVNSNKFILLGEGDVGYGREYEDWKAYSEQVPVANAVTLKDCDWGTVDITEHPNGDDEWHFNLTLLLEFEGGTWKRMVWNKINLAEDRPRFAGNWTN
jgi:hypothetical protein